MTPIELAAKLALRSNCEDVSEDDANLLCLAAMTVRDLNDKLECGKKITAAMKRPVSGRCPCCHQRFELLKKHIEESHPEYLKVIGDRP